MKTIKRNVWTKIKILLLIPCLWLSFALTANAAILLDFHIDAWEEYGYPETSFKAVFKNFKDIIDGLVGPSSLISPIPNNDPYILGVRFFFADDTSSIGYMNKMGVYYTGSVEGGQEPGGWSGYPWDHYGIYTHPAGYFTLGGAPGTALAWGGNGSGQLGDGTTAESRSPILPSLPGAAAAVAAGAAFSLALGPDGSVWAWGSNTFGQLGTGSFTDSAVPVRVKDPTGQGFLTGIVAIAAGYEHALALDGSGKVYGWGANDAGQLGADPATLDRSSLPREIISGEARMISAGQQYSLAVSSDQGCVQAWGINEYGQLASGDQVNRFAPAAVITAAGQNLCMIKSISAGWNHALALDRYDKVWAWGKNEFGQLGYAGPDPSLTAVQSGPSDISAVAAGLGFSLAIDNTFKVWAWGGNWEGQLGDGTKADGTNPGRSTPSQVKISATENLGGIVQLSAGRFHGLALDSYGKLWTWGDNQAGALGRDPGETPESLYAVAVQDYGGQGDLGDILDIAAGNLFSLALAKPGLAAAVALSSSANPAASGDAVTFTATVSPVDSGAGTPAGSVVFKEGHTILGSAPLVDGQASFTTSSLAAGPHGITALFSGTGFTAVSSQVLAQTIAVPIRIITNVMPAGVKRQPYRRAIAHAGGYGPTAWSLVDGSLPPGLALGNGIVTGTPTASGTFRFTVLASNSGFTDSRTLTLGISQPGRLFSWGSIDYEGTLTNVVSVSAGEVHGAALDADGEVWSWGNNDYGQLGNGQICTTWPCPSPVTVPIQPVGLEGRSFTQVVAGDSHSIALESNGNVWIWGVSDSNLPAYSWTNPVPIRFTNEDGSLLGGITALALGRDHAWGLAEDGGVFMLGPHATRVAGPEGTGELQEIIAVAAWGWYTLALSRDGSVYEWGHYTYSADGWPTYVNRPFPTRIEVAGGSPLTNIVEVAAGEYSGMALDAEGRVWAWGANNDGQLGQGVPASTEAWSRVALQVKKPGGSLSDIGSISAGGKSCLALDAQGRLWAWGNDASLPYVTYAGNAGMGYVTGFSTGRELMAMILSGMGGDLTGDSRVDLADAILGLKLLAGAPVGDVRLDATVTGTQRIGLGEVLYILQRLAWLRGGD